MATQVPQGWKAAMHAATDASELLERTRPYFSEMKGADLCTLLHKVAKLSPGCVEQHAELTDLLGELKGVAEAQAVLAKLSPGCVEQHAELTDLLGELTRRCGGPGSPGISAKYFCAVVWSCAMLHVHHQPLLAIITAAASQHMNQIPARELSGLTWALAKLSFHPRDLIDSIVTRVHCRREGKFGVQCLSTIACSLASLGRYDVALLHSFSQELALHAGTLKPVEISNTLWAFAKSRCCDAELFRALGDAAAEESKIRLFKTHELASAAWAFAKTGVRHHAFFAHVELACLERCGEFTPESIARLLWAFTRLKVTPNSSLIPTLLRLSLQMLPRHTPEDLSIVAWIASKHCPGHGNFFGEVARCCAGRLDDLTPGSLVRLLKALATVKTDNPVGFADVLHDVAENHLQRLHHSELCGLLRSAVVASINVAYTDCKACIDTTTGRICRHLEEHALQLRPKDLVDVAASLALWQGGGGEQLRNIIRQRRSELDEHRMTHDLKGLRRSLSVTSLSTADEEDEEAPAILGHKNVQFRT
eukprot:CAMPEP_0172935962 /NCGR_PEP_ID=MMETSP1075-20121228/221777_1 /TAXON_ID=2916 /ORGANISM="Ceratium fusus, Strain PA161109" /LENGTH=534 /DNA_ID=CAMNT_0013797325 /DNA_START=83 /DNA_END=1688 /DNA_ORIENTATION=-